MIVRKEMLNEVIILMEVFWFDLSVLLILIL